ncbi:type VI secretion system membrane subunit TssM [Ascidiaceihabitans sp.]|uniref:type VI secretion system membrane subunit TssM n=1 Tax=Ascidiaceihabitans sp. TaxID=1872644 RepID=UPI0032991C7C
MPKLKLAERPWLRTTLLVFCLLALMVAIWVIPPMTPILFIATVWFRLLIIGILLAIFGTVWFIRWRRRKKAADALEEAIMPEEPTGDGKVLAERMQGALATLKKSGGSTYLYDLPWYVIIGPPGAGKTTALVNSGIEFPLAGDAAAGLEGFGGTRFCDWWFAEDAIMIDTAGRYTTQDSDAAADEASWQSFLDLLKKSRPNQPINGVILAFSVEDMMTSNEETLARHAETVRARLAEVHETLKIDFPVYVLFTKADLISGFREFFSSFSMARRNGVWGVTFQTKDRKALTHEGVADEFDALVARMSDEVIDRLTEEPDGIARISIFGLPGQMALMRDNVSEFLRRVFEPTRYKTNAMLRGFYFTSGTQEGTPIDQVLGAMSRIGEGGGGFASSFMSGKGKSFFIHDLLKKVIFEERDWVSHDRKAIRRTAIFRGLAIGTIVLGTLGLLGALGYSYWQNASLVEIAEKEADTYEREAITEINRELIGDIQLDPILPFLNDIRDMPAGYGDSEDATVWEGLGLGQRNRLQAAAEKSYSDALEKMLRPRMMLALEQQMPYIINSGETTEIYRALKVYMSLGGQGKGDNDEAIKSYFDQLWRAAFQGRDGINTRDQLNDHLTAMLELDDARGLLVSTDGKTVTTARAAIVQLPIVDQAYALVMDGAKGAGLRDWVLTERTGSTSSLVFEAKDGSDLSALKVDGIFTYEGFWSYFFPQLEVVAQRLRDDQWVLGEESDDEGQRTEIDDQINRLDRALQERYRADFKKAWDGLFDNLALASMAADKPRYNALGAAASASASPILMLVREVDAETKLTREFEGMEGLTPEMLAGGAALNTDAGSVGASVSNSVIGRVRSRSSGVQRILMDAVLGKGGGAGGAIIGGGGGGGDSITRPIERIEEEFVMWHELLEGPSGQRAIDAVLGNLGQVWNNLRLSVSNPGQSAVMMPQLLSNLTQYNSQMPPTLAGLINEAESDFQKGASDANLATMNRALTDQITFFCRQTITSSYPFANAQRSVSMDNFTKFFGPGGDMDSFFATYLNEHVERTSEGLRYVQDRPLASRLSTSTLRQFERAERIRQAFFSGGTAPQVEITVAHVDSHPTIDSAKLTINDMEIPTVRGDSPKTVVWPGPGKATVLELTPTLDRDSGLQLRGSSWTFIEFLRSASARNQRGDTLRATYTIGGRNITYDFTINAIANPFTMRELRDFKCPASLD